MPDGTTIRAAAAPKRRRKRVTLPGRCWVEGCGSRPAISDPVNMCAAHVTSIVAASRDRDADRILGRCIWPKCIEYAHIHETKMCTAHTAIVMYHGHRNPSAQARYYGLRGLDNTIDDPLEPERPPATVPNDGTIYALLSGYNVKIGWTGRDLQARLREYPPSTELLVHFPGKRGDETRIKRKFAHLRTHGNEWFPYAPQVTEWVDLMVREHGSPDPTIVCGPAKYRVPRPHSQTNVLRPRDYRGLPA